MDVNIMAGGRVGQPGLARCTPAVGKVGRLAGRWRNCCCNNAPPSRDHGRCPRQRVTKFRKPVRRNKTRKARSSTACGWMRAERKGQERLTNPPFFPEQMWGKIAANPSSRFTDRKKGCFELPASVVGTCSTRFTNREQYGTGRWGTCMG
jgi:hypothetical protein